MGNTEDTLATLGTQYRRYTGNIGYTRHRTKTKKNRMGNTEDTLATLGTQDTGRRQIKTEWAIQKIHWQHWVHNTQDEDK
jgi:predicted transposase YbfD/YdcC